MAQHALERSSVNTWIRCSRSVSRRTVSTQSYLRIFATCKRCTQSLSENLKLNTWTFFFCFGFELFLSSHHRSFSRCVVWTAGEIWIGNSASGRGVVSIKLLATASYFRFFHLKLWPNTHFCKTSAKALFHKRRLARRFKTGLRKMPCLSTSNVFRIFFLDCAVSTLCLVALGYFVVTTLIDTLDLARFSIWWRHIVWIMQRVASDDWFICKWLEFTIGVWAGWVGLLKLTSVVSEQFYCKYHMFFRSYRDW